MNFQDKYPSKDITRRIIACAIEVHFNLGPGLLESIHEESLAYEFQLREIRYNRQKEIYLSYKGRDLGQHRINFQIRLVFVLFTEPFLYINHKQMNYIKINAIMNLKL